MAQLKTAQRREDREVAEGVRAARAAQDPAARRDAIMRAMTPRTTGGGGIDGFHEHDDVTRRWVQRPASAGTQASVK